MDRETLISKLKESGEFYLTCDKGRESLELSESFDFEGFFPCVVVGAIDSGFDRLGSVSMICLDYVELNKYINEI